MEFQTEAQKACYEKVLPWMKEIFGDFLIVDDDRPKFAVVIGSAIVHVNVFPWGSDDSTITARAWVVNGAELVPDLTLWLLRKNDEFRFGAFGVDEDGDIFFEHTIVGSSCDKNELKASAEACG
jgi:hypothetical protein